MSLLQAYLLGVITLPVLFLVIVIVLALLVDFEPEVKDRLDEHI